MARPHKPSQDYASDEPKEELEENARENGVRDADKAVDDYEDAENNYGNNEPADGPDKKKSDEKEQKVD